ncbi:MAG: UDP-2,3-diacylglucosamine diphosphatase [Noviherbaspirillum sp.]
MTTPDACHPAPAARPETVALFVSDLHLQESSPATTALFLSFLAQHAPHARQLYLLGDLFEYWAGDDDMATPYLRHIVDALHELSGAGVQIFWMAGNRDFLVGEAFARAAGMTLLPDPYVAQIAGIRITLAHGDAQCTDDRDYQAFRAQVRNPQWQQAFLAQPLAKRKAIIDGMRSGSRAAQRGKTMDIMDVNQQAVSALFDATGTALMIHGHTHRPGVHRHGSRVRFVLPDWDGDVSPPRGGWLALDADGVIHRHDAFGTRLSAPAAGPED